MRRVRAGLVWVWPFLAAFAVAAVIVAATVAIWSIFDQRAEERKQRVKVAELAVDVRRLAGDTKAISAANNAILEEQRRREIERQPLIDGAIKRIVDDNAEAHAALLGQIARILNRPVPAAATPPPRPVTTVPPRTTVPRAAPLTTTTTRPATSRPAPTTTTTCPTKGRSEKCR